MKKVKNMSGYAVLGWVEVDQVGRIVTGNIGVKVYARKQDILDEGFGPDEVSKAMIVVDVPKKLKP